MNTNTSDKIFVKVAQYEASIGKPIDSYLNVFLNFNPIRTLDILKSIDSSDMVDFIMNAANYNNGTGGLGIKLQPNYTVQAFAHELEKIIRKHIETLKSK